VRNGIWIDTSGTQCRTFGHYLACRIGHLVVIACVSATCAQFAEHDGLRCTQSLPGVVSAGPARVHSIPRGETAAVQAAAHPEDYFAKQMTSADRVVSQLNYTGAGIKAGHACLTCWPIGAHS
jgi:hypothetical protein